MAFTQSVEGSIAQGFTMHRTSETPFQFPSDMRELQAVVKRCGSHFFDADTMRFFRSRCDDEMSVGLNRETVYFVTSEQRRGESREYTVRSWSWREPSSIERASELGQFGTLRRARKEAKRLAMLTFGEVES